MQVERERNAGSRPGRGGNTDVQMSELRSQCAIRYRIPEICLRLVRHGICQEDAQVERQIFIKLFRHIGVHRNLDSLLFRFSDAGGNGQVDLLIQTVLPDGGILDSLLDLVDGAPDFGGVPLCGVIINHLEIVPHDRR